MVGLKKKITQYTSLFDRPDTGEHERGQVVDRLLQGRWGQLRGPTVLGKILTVSINLDS